MDGVARCHLDHVYIRDNREWQRVCRLRRCSQSRRCAQRIDRGRQSASRGNAGLRCPSPAAATAHATASDTAPTPGMYVFAVAHVRLRGGQRRHRRGRCIDNEHLHVDRGDQCRMDYRGAWRANRQWQGRLSLHAQSKRPANGNPHDCWAHVYGDPASSAVTPRFRPFLSFTRH